MKWPRLQSIMASRRVRWGTTIAAVLIYVIFFILAFEQVGPILGALAIFPVIIAGGLFGAKVGIITGLLTIPLNTVLLNIVLGQSRWDILRTEGGFVGIAAITVIGGVVGYLHELNRRVQEAERRLSLG